MQTIGSNFFFVINPGSGADNINWFDEISNYFKGKPQQLSFFELHKDCNIEEIVARIDAEKPHLVIAAGGDGTVKLVAECLQGKNIPMAILPAGSANGMAKELGIPSSVDEALAVLEHGQLRKIHLLKVNNEVCIHLSDAGFNAFVVKKFEEGKIRGQWGYVKAAWKALWQHGKMKVAIKADSNYKNYDASMVVLANATMYGNGVVINPKGDLSDALFEIVVIKKISFVEIFKMKFTQAEFNKDKTEVFQTSSVKISSKRRLHFQVDGEYRGMVNEIKAEIMPAALAVLVAKA